MFVAFLLMPFLAGCATSEVEAGPSLVPSVVPIVEYYHGMVRRVPSATGCVALTFDDGPNAIWTPQLLAILAEEDAVGTFFLVGRWVAERPDLAAAIRAGGNEIGNHSWSHPQLTTLSSDGVRREIAATDAAVLSATGRAPTLIRFPFGDNDARVLALMDRPVIFWDVDLGDWSHHSPDQVVAAVLGATHSGSIVGMHDTHSNTIIAIRQIIRALRARGYQLVTVSRLLTGQPCRPISD